MGVAADVERFCTLCIGFLKYLADFGRRFGAKLGAKWSQNRAFWHQEASKVGKMTSRKGCWKKLEILMEF